MYRFDLEVYIYDKLIFSKVFKSLTSVCKCIDCFSYEKLSFNLIDSIKGNYIDVDELMVIWHK